MKKVIDLSGNEVEVSVDTPVKTKNGVHYLLNADDEKELKDREARFAKTLAERKANEYKEKRAAEYGTLVEQIEFLTEFGLEAWQKKVNDIKLKYPKGE